MYNLLALKEFTDIYSGEHFFADDEIIVDSFQTVRRLVTKGVAGIQSANHGKDPKTLIFMTLLSNIGGIETMCQNIARKFGPDVCFVFKCADPLQLLMLAEHSDVIMDEGQKYAPKVAVYNSVEAYQSFEGQISAESQYQICHADYEALHEINDRWQWELAPVPDNHVVAVSEVCARSIESVYKRSAVVHTPILSSAPKRLVLGAFTRATAEKGIDRLLKFCDQLTNAGIDHCLFLATRLDNHPEWADEIAQRSQIIPLPPSIYSTEIMRACDYICQFSLSESYCYTVHEALAMGKPVLVSDIEAFRGIVKDGQNGYIITDFDNIDVPKIVTEIPKIRPKAEKMDPFWAKLIKGGSKC